MQPKFVSEYILKKAEVDEVVAMTRFSSAFALEAVTEGWEKVRGRASKKIAAIKHRSSLIGAAAQNMHQPIAVSCEAYLQARQTKIESVSFEDLLDRIKEGTRKAADAVDLLAAQLLRQYLELKKRSVDEIDMTRFVVLHSLGTALNAEFIDKVDGEVFSEMVSPGPIVASERMRMHHGLQGLRFLSDAAGLRLKEFRSRELISIADDGSALRMPRGDYADREQDAFISDLACIYEAHVGRVTCHRGSSTSGSTPSPFVRFVRRVFDEVEAVAGAEGIPQEELQRSVDKIAKALERTGTAAMLAGQRECV